MPESIKMSNTHKDRLKKYADIKDPYEACALLVGVGIEVMNIIFIDNIASEPEKFFTMSTGQILEAYKTAQRDRLEIIGVFHSHPTSKAYPSKTDIKFMETNPVTWVIYSGVDKDMRAYWNDMCNNNNNNNKLQNVSIVYD